MRCFRVEPDWFEPQGWIKEDTWILPHQILSAMNVSHPNLLWDYRLSYEHIFNVLEDQEKAKQARQEPKPKKTDVEIGEEAMKLYDSEITIDLSDKGQKEIGQRLHDAWVWLVENNTIDANVDLFKLFESEETDLVCTTQDFISQLGIHLSNVSKISKVLLETFDGGSWMDDDDLFNMRGNKK